MIDRHKIFITLLLLFLICMEAGFSLAYTLCAFQIISQNTSTGCSCGCTADCCTVGKSCCCDSSAPLPFNLHGIKQFKPCSPNEPPSLAPVSPFFTMFYLVPDQNIQIDLFKLTFVDGYQLNHQHPYPEPPTPPPDFLFS